ncbi:MAG: hypothetical protein Q9187_006696, partial [Circinaria calcarea]
MVQNKPRPELLTKNHAAKNTSLTLNPSTPPVISRSTNFSIPNPRHIFPGTFKRRRNMVYNGDFGATMYIKGYGWSKFHSVEENGTVKRRNTKDLILFGHDKDVTTQLINAAGYFGLAAAKIFIPTPTEDAMTIMSGFWMEQEYFVSCCHFLPGFQGEEAACIELANSLKSKEQQRIR